MCMYTKLFCEISFFIIEVSNQRSQNGFPHNCVCIWKWLIWWYHICIFVYISEDKDESWKTKTAQEFGWKSGTRHHYSITGLNFRTNRGWRVYTSIHYTTTSRQCRLADQQFGTEIQWKTLIFLRRISRFATSSQKLARGTSNEAHPHLRER